MRILPLGQMFRPKTSHVYPPFKNGRYMEEYMYEYIQQYPIDTDFVYLPVLFVVLFFDCLTNWIK
jgi:hypothetical protein